jgi:hypothetical protein
MQEHRAKLISWQPIRNSIQQQDFPGMLSAGYSHPFSSRFAASVVGIDNDREGQRSGYQLLPGAGQNSIKIGSFLREQNYSRLSNCNAYYFILHVNCDFDMHECDFYTQRAISRRNSVIFIPRV